MKCFVEELELLLCMILYWEYESMEGDGLQPPKNGGRQRKLRRGQPWKAKAVVWQWVFTFKETVPPTPTQDQ